MVWQQNGQDSQNRTANQSPALLLLTAPSLLQPEEVRQLVRVGQEAFLTQLLDIGFFHG